MSKELDYLDKILNYQPLTLVERTIIECIKEKVQRAEAIDNANPSEALENLKYLKNLTKVKDVLNVPWWNESYEIVEKALLKAEKEHNSINLLMRELDCKDFAELRKYARCGKEIEVPENE